MYQFQIVFFGANCLWI